MGNKRGLEISFAWMFSIIVGVAIIFLAIFAAVRLVNLGRQQTDTEIGKQLGILLNPVETSLESTRVTAPVVFSTETRVFNKCMNQGNFGTEEISVSSSSGIGSKWGAPGVPYTFNNKYLFSSGTLEGSKIYFLIKPFSMPYKIADLIIAWTDKQKYCFVNPENDMADDITGSNMQNINISERVEDCPKNYTTVCFTSTGCDIDVINSGLVRKKGQTTVSYIDTENNALIYAAIFSDPLLYDCQVQRLRQRASELALLYSSKSSFLGTKGCTSTLLQPALASYANATRSMNVSLNSVAIAAANLAQENDNLGCRLF